MAFSIVVGLIIGIFSTSFSPIIIRGLGLHQTINGLIIFWMILVSPITGALYVLQSIRFSFLTFLDMNQFGRSSA